jgi:hypothetical protein
MFKLRIHPRDIDGPWTWTGRQWQAGTSWIEPYTHPALEVLGPDDTSPAMIIRERCPAVTGQPHHTGWPGDFITIQPSNGTMWIEAGVRGVAPLYLIVTDTVLHGSWDVADLAPSLRHAPLNEHEVVRQLSTTFRYTHDTLWQGLHWLTERSQAVFGAHGLGMRYPLPAGHGRPRELAPGADPVAAYEQLLDLALSQRFYDPASTAVELSGGLDSANVAASLGAAHPGQIAAAAMIIVGPAGVQQQDRRRQMIDLFRLGPDVTTSMTDNLPLRPGGRRASRALITPYDELYDEGKTTLLGLLRSRGIRTVATGIGGDEMVALTAAELSRAPLGTDPLDLPWTGPHSRDLRGGFDTGTAPASIVNEVTLLAAACVAPPILRAGMWPIHSLADPALIRFGEWLPYSWRHLKRLHVARLERVGCGPYLVDPPLRENFEPVMDEALHRHGVAFLRAMLDRGSPLIDDGYLNPDELAAAATRITDGTPAPGDNSVCNVIALEAALSSFGHAESPTPVPA